MKEGDKYTSTIFLKDTIFEDFFPFIYEILYLFYFMLNVIAKSNICRIF